MSKRNAWARLGWGLMGIGTVAFGQALPVRNAQGLLVGSDGRTLYTYDADTPGHSACSGHCLIAWPAYLAPASASAQGDFSLITRPEGARQWAFRDKPLYRFEADQKPGDALGNDVNGNWHVIADAPAAAVHP